MSEHIADEYPEDIPSTIQSQAEYARVKLMHTEVQSLLSGYDGQRAVDAEVQINAMLDRIFYEGWIAGAANHTFDQFEQENVETDTEIIDEGDKDE